MHASGSRNRCSIRCVWYVSSMMWADAAEAFFDVAAFELRFAEQVRAALRMDQRRTGLECRVRIGHRLEHFVFDVDQLGRLAGQPLRVGDDAGDDVAACSEFLRRSRRTPANLFR